MKILPFGASSSSQSINRQFANYAANLVPGAVVTDLDLRNFELPLYSADREKADGIPAGAQEFLDAVRAHDSVVISLAEHNGSYTAAFKNLYDWTSRLEQKVWSGKPMLLLSTSPGARGGATVLATAEATFSRMGGEVMASFSLPSFYDNFTVEEGIKDAGLKASLELAVGKLSGGTTEPGR